MISRRLPEPPNLTVIDPTFESLLTFTLRAAGGAGDDRPVVTVADATCERWDDLVTVIGTRGDPPLCWCQWFRHRRPDLYATPVAQRRADLQAQVGSPVPPGVLVYDDAGVPSGWCAVAPRADYPRLTTYRIAATGDEDGLWAVTCFVVRVGARRRGLAEVLLDGAVDLARRHGARVIEAYPLDTTMRKAMAFELRRGPLSVFLRAGFREVGTRAAPARPVVRLALQRGQPSGAESEDPANHQDQARPNYLTQDTRPPDDAVKAAMFARRDFARNL